MPQFSQFGGPGVSFGALISRSLPGAWGSPLGPISPLYTIARRAPSSLYKADVHFVHTCADLSLLLGTAVLQPALGATTEVRPPHHLPASCSCSQDPSSTDLEPTYRGA